MKFNDKDKKKNIFTKILNDFHRTLNDFISESIL